MARTKLAMQKIKFAWAIALALVNLIESSVGIRAQSTRPVVSSTNFGNLPTLSIESLASRLSWIINFKPPSRGRPAQTHSTGRRGECQNWNPPLIALVPLTQKSLNRSSETTVTEDRPEVLGKTTEPYPVFWFHVPELPPDIRFAEFRLLNENNNNVLKKRHFIELRRTPGIVGFSLPSTEESLKLDKQYRWSFRILCEPREPSKNPSVSGWVERVELSSTLKSQLEQATERERVEIYAENGIWHETLAFLAELRRKSPKDETLVESWANLLRDIGLNEIAEERNICVDNICLGD